MESELMRYFKHMEVAQGSSRRGANAASVAQHQSYDVHDNGGGGGTLSTTCTIRRGSFR